MALFTRFDPAAYPVGADLFIAGGAWMSRDVAKYTVERITPSGIIVAAASAPSGARVEVRVNKRGHIVGAASYDRRSIVTAKEAQEIRQESRQRRAWQVVGARAEDVATAARQKDADALAQAFEALIEARDALASVDTHPEGGDANAAPFMSGAVAKPDAQPTAKGHPNA